MSSIHLYFLIYFQPNSERNPVEEMKEAEESGDFVYAAPIEGDEDDEENFENVEEENFEEVEETVPEEVIKNKNTFIRLGKLSIFQLYFHLIYPFRKTIPDFFYVKIAFICLCLFFYFFLHFVIFSFAFFQPVEAKPEKVEAPPPVAAVADTPSEPISKQSVEDLEKELELDLENVNIEDLDTAVSINCSLLVLREVDL